MTQQARRRQIEKATEGAYPHPGPPKDAGGKPSDCRSAAEYGAWLAKATADIEVPLDDLRFSFSRSGQPGTEAEFLAAYFGTPAALHFVGFRGDEYTSAARCFGRPDFFHRTNDVRLVRGGELAPHDTVVYANGSERAVRLDAADDSNIDVQAFEKEQRNALW